MPNIALSPITDMTEKELDEYIVGMIPKFQWFTHVNFGNGIMARSTAWPDAPLDSRHVGESKFEFIVRRNLCDLQGKRILELGCNAGVVSRHMVRLGAREVVGVDSHSTWPDWLEQAQFVTQVLEKRCDQKYNVKFIDMDLRDVPSADLGNFDAVIALNCLYYVEEENVEKIIRHVSSVSDRFLIQCNTVDQKHLGKRPTPAYMKRALTENGFSVVKVDAPWDTPRKWIIPRRYHRPVVVGTKR